MNTDQYFKIFKIKDVKELSMKELKRRHRILVHKYHPDKGGSNKQFVLIQEAYNYILELLIQFIEGEQVKFFNERYLYYGDGSVYDKENHRWVKIKGKLLKKKA